MQFGVTPVPKNIEGEGPKLAHTAPRKQLVITLAGYLEFKSCGESDADVAVVLAGQPGDFVDTKLEMAGLAFEVLLDTGVLIQALPVWECEWANPKGYSTPELLENIVRDGLVLWRAG